MWNLQNFCGQSHTPISDRSYSISAPDFTPNLSVWSPRGFAFARCSNRAHETIRSNRLMIFVLRYCCYDCVCFLIYTGSCNKAVYFIAIAKLSACCCQWNFVTQATVARTINIGWNRNRCIRKTAEMPRQPKHVQYIKQQCNIRRHTVRQM